MFWGFTVGKAFLNISPKSEIIQKRTKIFEYHPKWNFSVAEDTLKKIEKTNDIFWKYISVYARWEVDNIRWVVIAFWKHCCHEFKDMPIQS